MVSVDKGTDTHDFVLVTSALQISSLVTGFETDLQLLTQQLILASLCVYNGYQHVNK